jgi:hypothetical protein
MFEKSLTDLIRGIRANKKSEQKYISVCLQEIRTEVKLNDLDIKANAIAKLTYVRHIILSLSFVRSSYIHSIASNAGLRHVVGKFPYCRSHVESKVSSQTKRLPGSHIVVSTRHRCIDADNQSDEKSNVVNIKRE